jgi:hypothetical protein
VGHASDATPTHIDFARIGFGINDEFGKSYPLEATGSPDDIK